LIRGKRSLDGNPRVAGAFCALRKVFTGVPILVDRRGGDDPEIVGRGIVC